MNAPLLREPHLPTELEEARNAMEWLVWRAECAEQEAFEAVKEYEAVKRKYAPPIPEHGDPF